MSREAWTEGAAYDRFMGRWSERVAEGFVSWLEVPSRSRWLDVGCGTGRLTRVVGARAAPASVVGIDPSHGFVLTARDTSEDPRVRFLVGDGHALPLADDSFDAAASGLVLHFASDPERMVAEQVRVVRPGGIVGWYVWDSAEGMEFLNRFWDVAIDLDPAAADLYESVRLSARGPDALRGVAEAAGLDPVRIRPFDVPTRFAGFDDYWEPFLGAQGPSPAYVARLSDDRRRELRERLRSALPVGADGSIDLRARAWAVRGTVPSSR